MYPPNQQDWFIEFLTVRDAERDQGEWARVELSAGHFALRAFEFSPLLTFNPSETPSGILCARTEMMALANLLEHPRIKPEFMSALFAERRIKRTNKDLGRVLAIAFLAADEDKESWAREWNLALQRCFPKRRAELATKAGHGLRALLDSANDFEEALHTCANGLLAHRRVTLEQLRIAGERLMLDAIEPLANAER